jgi:hypothetical protein
MNLEDGFGLYRLRMVQRGHKWSDFPSGWIRVFHTRWVMSGHYLGSLCTLFPKERRFAFFGEKKINKVYKHFHVWREL